MTSIHTMPDDFALYTGGKSKTPDFTIYYNIAANNLEKLEKQWKERPDKDLLLAKYIWKADENIRNKTTGYEITKQEQQIITKLTQKLNAIRNYYSHIWHSNDVLVFDETLKKFLQERYEIALAATADTNPGVVDDYYNLKKKYKEHYQLFKKVGKSYFITEEGRIFFLSFFLTTGQMSRFLQQRKGNKRTDLPLFRFKRLIYTYYCHRDGASIAHFNQGKEQVQAMEEKLVKDISKARQAYRIINYLYDYPAYLSPDSKLQLNIDNAPVQTVQDILVFIKHHRLLPDLSFTEIPVNGRTDDNSKNEFQKKRSIAFTIQDIPASFHISFDNLYLLAMLCLKYGNGKTELLVQHLTQVAGRIGKLKQVLKDGTWDKETDFLADRANRDLRGYRKLTEAGIIFFEAYDKDRTKAMIKMADKLLSEFEKEDAIIVFVHDFTAKEEQKLRVDNVFLTAAARYLMDNAELANGLYWEVETFEGAEKRKEFRQEIPHGYRLSIAGDHITVALRKASRSDDTGADWHKFSLGRRTVKYLLACHLFDKSKDIATFFIQLKDDLEMIGTHMKNGTAVTDAGLQLLEAQFIGSYLKPTGMRDDGDVLAAIKAKVKFIFNEWDTLLQKRQYLKRAEKNRAIMDCYRFFDWPEDAKGETKFLRANEYNQMSVCHYSLPVKEQVKQKPYWEHLYKDLFGLDRRKPKVADGIYRLLSASENIDALLQNVIHDRKKALQDDIDLLSILPKPKRKELTIKLCKKLKIDIPSKYRDAEHHSNLIAKQQQTFAHLPFPVHPMLVYKYYKGLHPHYKEQVMGTPAQQNGLFQQVRNAYGKGLHAAHYEQAFAANTSIMTHGCTAGKSNTRKWTGAINDTYTEDAILWQIAQHYLKNNSYTAAMGEQLQKRHKEMQVGNLWGQDILIKLGDRGANFQNQLDKDSKAFLKNLQVRVKFHQLDDLMFSIDLEKLQKAAVHYYRRMTAEKDYWQADAEAGTATQPEPIIDFELLRREIQLVSHTGQYLAGYLLDFERAVIHAQGNDTTERQRKLKELANGKPYISFKAVLAQSETAYADALGKYRSEVFHSDIPVDGSFSYWARPGGDIGTELGIAEPLHQPKDREKYKISDDADKE